MITSTFTPGTQNTDNLTFEQMLANEGVYGSGNDEPRFVVIDGVAHERDLSTGDLVGVVSTVDPSVSFRRLTGSLSLTLTS